jgi:hypothetical protein
VLRLLPALGQVPVAVAERTLWAVVEVAAAEGRAPAQRNR